MGEVYRDCGQEPIRLVAKEDNAIVGICQAILIDAKRGRHLAVPYGPVLNEHGAVSTEQLLDALRQVALEHRCAFIRMSPFLPQNNWERYCCNKNPSEGAGLAGPAPGGHDLGKGEPVRGKPLGFPLTILPSPLHLLAEHVWYLPLQDPDPWMAASHKETSKPANQQTLFAAMRKTTRNLIRRAEKEGVRVEASRDPMGDLRHFLALHDETRKRHGFTPYTDAFFQAQVARFALRKECTLYLARYQGHVIAASIHMHAFGETSYHHGASSYAHSKIPSSYLLQWTAIRDALKRGDSVYNFWGIAPGNLTDEGFKIAEPKHPFAGVTLFKTGFGGKLLNVMHCQDIPIAKTYYLTRGFETLRKWKRGF
jgi:lipid II:glycine glycyltransferase (peptidoglycan interpeptide bridge formation enzyme)